jgi:hypothetical protein
MVSDPRNFPSILGNQKEPNFPTHLDMFPISEEFPQMNIPLMTIDLNFVDNDELIASLYMKMMDFAETFSNYE